MISNNYIGILGLGEFSTIHYIKKFNDKWHDEFGAYSTCPLKILQVDFNTINPELPFNFEKLMPIVKSHIIELYEMGVSAIVVPNITLHLTIDKIDFPAEIKDILIHPIKETIQFLQSKKIDDVAIYSTRYTMNSEWLNKYFEEQNITVHHLPQNLVDTIDKIRTSVFKSGTDDDVKEQWQNLNLLKTNGILLCTELSLLNDGHIDAVQIQINQAYRHLIKK